MNKRVRIYWRVGWQLILAYCLLCIHLSYSQSPSLTLYSLSESNGLSDNRVTCIFQDHRGFMWIGTEDGLNRYDGSVFKIFKRKNNDTSELADNHIRAIAEDRQHHLWIGTQHGLSEFDPDTKTFRTHQCNLLVKDINVMSAVWPDGKGNIWIGSWGGLLQFIPSQNRFITHFISSGRASDNRIAGILTDKKNELWIGTYNGLWKYSIDKGSFERVKAKGDLDNSTGLINSIAESREGKLLIGYWSLGLVQFDPETGVIKYIVTPEVESNVQGIAELTNRQGQHDIWCADLLKVDRNEKITKYAIRINPPSANYHITKLYTSRDGLLWLCSDKGVMIMDPMKQFFHHEYFSKKITHQGIAFQQKGKDIYVGGKGQNFLTLYDSAFNVQKSYLLSKELFPEKHDERALLSIVREDKEHLWLCTEEGLVLLNERDGAQQLYQLNENECKVPTRNFFSHLLIDSHRIYWVFPWRGGIWQFDPVRQKFSRIIEGVTQEAGKIKGLVISTALEDSLGNIWFADVDEGLIHFNRTTKFFSKPTEKDLPAGYSLTNIFYERPFIWAATNGNIIRVHERTMAVDRWPVPEELDKAVTGFTQDRQNHLWITTRSGLLSFDKTTHQFKHFTVNDGLNDNMMVGSIFCLKNGKIVYGDENYITTFDPEELVKSTSVPSVQLTDVLSQNQPLEISVNNVLKKYIELDYTYNNFTFEWAVLNYSNPSQNRYYCKLEGVDKDWKYVGNTGQVQYASLSPGRYTFRAKGATSAGLMNESGDEIVIIIRPPFWKSWWFFSLCSVFILGLMYGWYRYRLNEVLKTEKLRNKISSDLHDEIGSTLSSISIMSDLVVQKTKEEKTTEVANEIRENAILLMERMDDIVWSINPKNDSMENLLLRVKRFAAQVFEAKDIDYEIHIDQNVEPAKLPMEFRQNVYLILKEAINNLVKHSQCTKVQIEVSQKQSVMNLYVIDNGHGFDVELAKSGNGLSSMRNRAAKMKMDLIIRSQKGQGTEIQLIVKIK